MKHPIGSARESDTRRVPAAFWPARNHRAPCALLISSRALDGKGIVTIIIQSPHVSAALGHSGGGRVHETRDTKFVLCITRVFPRATGNPVNYFTRRANKISLPSSTRREGRISFARRIEPTSAVFFNDRAHVFLSRTRRFPERTSIVLSSVASDRELSNTKIDCRPSRATATVWGRIRRWRDESVASDFETDAAPRPPRRISWYDRFRFGRGDVPQ